MRQANGTYTNQVCSISTVPTNPTSNDGEPSNNLSTDTGETEQTTLLSNPPPLFGAQIQFNLEGVVNCPEYLCYFPLLKRFDLCFLLILNVYRIRILEELEFKIYQIIK